MKHALMIALSACVLLLVGPDTSSAAKKTCKMSVVGGSQKGRTVKLEMRHGRLVGKGVKVSSLPECHAFRKIYGRLYHICDGGRVTVLKRQKSTNSWVPLADKNQAKFKHNCF